MDDFVQCEENREYCLNCCEPKEVCTCLGPQNINVSMEEEPEWLSDDEIPF